MKNFLNLTIKIFVFCHILVACSPEIDEAEIKLVLSKSKVLNDLKNNKYQPPYHSGHEKDVYEMCTSKFDEKFWRDSRYDIYYMDIVSLASNDHRGMLERVVGTEIDFLSSKYKLPHSGISDFKKDEFVTKTKMLNHVEKINSRQSNKQLSLNEAASAACAHIDLILTLEGVKTESLLVAKQIYFELYEGSLKDNMRKLKSMSKD